MLIASWRTDAAEVIAFAELSQSFATSAVRAEAQLLTPWLLSSSFLRRQSEQRW